MNRISGFISANWRTLALIYVLGATVVFVGVLFFFWWVGRLEEKERELCRYEDKTENEPSEPENGKNEANTTSETGKDDGGQQDSVIIPQGTMKVTVVCDGALNLRRSPAWGNENICGRAVRGQSYYVKEIHTVDGKKMVRTIDDLYLSGLSEHVQFEQL